MGDVYTLSCLWSAELSKVFVCLVLVLLFSTLHPSCLAIILTGKRELIALLELYH